MHQHSLSTWREHAGCVYSAVWSYQCPQLFASCSSDSSIKIFDRNLPQSVQTIPGAHDGAEILSLDWSKYNKDILFTGGVDSIIKMWDLRFMGGAGGGREVGKMVGHQMAVRCLKSSPFDAGLLASCGYDMTLRVWDTERQCEIDVYDAHSEFVYGLDWNLFVRNELATASWDESVHYFIPRSLAAAI